MGKKYLYIAIIVALLAFSYAVVAYIGAFNNSIDPNFTRSFQVSGEGKIVAVPDIAQFMFTVITEGGKDIGALQKINSDKNNAIMDFIKSRGIDKEDIKTEGYNVSPRYQYYNCGPVIYDGSAEARSCPPAEIVGFSITQTVSVKVREDDFDIIGDLLSGVVTNGANSVSQLSFTIDDPTAVEQKAREKAIEQAKEKAKATAKAAGFHLGRLLSLNEGGGFYPVYKTTSFERLDAGGGVAASAPAVEPGSQNVTITVTLVYEIR